VNFTKDRLGITRRLKAQEVLFRHLLCGGGMVIEASPGAIVIGPVGQRCPLGSSRGLADLPAFRCGRYQLLADLSIDHGQRLGRNDHLEHRDVLQLRAGRP
jgi:hypothetical protein